MSRTEVPRAYAPGWQHVFHVGSYEVDPVGAARIASLFNYLQEAAGGHADHLDLGYHALRAHAGLGFVLSRITVEIESLPRWDDEIVVVTWPKRAEKLLALRDFVVLPANSAPARTTRGGITKGELEAALARPNPLIRATTAWLLIDVERMRPVRPERNLSHIPISPELNAVEAVPERLLMPTEAPHSEQMRIARYSDIDQNDHVNNARYVEWIADFLAASGIPTADHALPAPTTLDLVFTGEVKLGDQVVIQGSEDDSGAGHVWITRDEDTAVIARLQW